MKCELCGRQYIALGVHIRHKHGIAPNDYRDEFGILRTTPLVDEDLSANMRFHAFRRLQDGDYKAEVQERCRKNTEANRGRALSEMTRAGKAALAKRNKDANDKYLRSKAPMVAKVLREKKTLRDVAKELGCGHIAAKKMARLEGVEYSAHAAKSERAKRAALTIRNAAMERVAKVLPLLYTTKSAAEMCRLGGISTKTYKNWLKAGLITRHPNGRGPRGV